MIRVDVSGMVTVTCLGVLRGKIWIFASIFCNRSSKLVSTAQGLFLEAIPPLVLKAEVRHFSFAM